MNDVTSRFIECYNSLLSNNLVGDKKEFADMIGVSSSLITEIVKGRSNIGITAIQNTVLKFDLNEDWLFTGNGEMFNSNNPNNMDCNKCPFKNDITRYQRDLDRYQSEISYLNKQLDALRHHETPESKLKNVS
jgi:transcriptional regulator with XRE-family HTH domain